MNKDQIKGTVRDMAGKAQQAVGQAIDNQEMQVKGLRNQAVGNVEKAIGDAKQDIKKGRDTIKRSTNSR